MNKRYSIKFICLAYELPSTEVLSSDESVDKLKTALTSLYKDWFDVVLCNIAPYELPNFNGVFLYQLVARVDNLSINKADMEVAWRELQQKATEAIEEFLNSNDIIFNKLS